MASPRKIDSTSNSNLVTKVPNHIAIIMDGNGRWAKNRGLGRIFGHREGTRRVDDIVTECRNIGVKYLSLYTFSTENWNRPASEVNMLMKLLVQKLRGMLKKLVKNQVALVAQGSLEKLPKFAQDELYRVMELTAIPEPKLYLNLCLSYGGRQEIVDAAKAIAREVASGERSPDQIDESVIRAHLYQPQIPDPDLLIRTGGEFRVSNFLLWQAAYAEIWVTPVLWPEFRPATLHEAIEEFSSRERRFGKTSSQVQSETVSPRGLL